MTYTELLAAIKDYLNRTDLDARIQTFVNNAQRKIERSRNWRYMYRSATTSSGVYNPITLPTGYKNTHALFVTSDGDYKRLGKAPIEKAFLDYPDFTNDTGTPKEFAVDLATSQIIVRPTPDQTYTFTHQYYRYLDEFNGTTITTNAWSESAPELLLYGALLESAPFLIDDGRLATWGRLYDDAFSRLWKADVDDQWGGSPHNVKADYIV